MLLRRFPERSLKLRWSKAVKKTSSKWIKRLDSKYRQFYWQRGYGAFSVSPSQLNAVLEYVASQEEHHRFRLHAVSFGAEGFSARFGRTFSSPRRACMNQRP